MDYRAALEYFRDRSDYERGFVSNPFAGDDAAAAGLRRTRLLLDALGSPDRAYPIIHVAGTKGKGSTCAFIESVARQHGIKTGMFITPHLHTVRERIQINGQPVSEKSWSHTLAVCAAAIQSIETRQDQPGRITAFELNTAMAFQAFNEAGIDLAIVEVGLGGRLDATNVVYPDVSVVTPVSYDHQAILGDSLEEIAGEKAGIIKGAVPVVVSAQEPEALTAIESHAAAHDAPLFRAGSEWQTTFRDHSATLTGPWGEIVDLDLGLHGPHQAMNAGAAVMALWLLDPEIVNDLAGVTAGLQQVNWPGRYELVHSSPTVIVDGAHNGSSMAVLAQALRDDYPDRHIVVVFGSYTDKDLDAMLSELATLDPLVIATRSTSPRARPPHDIVEAASRIDIDAVGQPTVSQAITAALDRASVETVIVATGSLSIVAAVREYFGFGDVSPVEREVLDP